MEKLGYIDLLLKARLNELYGFLESSLPVMKEYFRRARADYQSLEKTSKSFKKQAIIGIIWACLFSEDIEASKSYLEKLRKISPTSPHIKSAEKAIEQFVVFRMSDDYKEYLVRERMKKPLEISLGRGLIMNLYEKSTDLFQICIVLTWVAMQEMERAKKKMNSMDEEGLRDVIKISIAPQLRTIMGSSVGGEVFNCKGKTDLFAENPNDEDEAKFISECKIWNGIKYYKDGFSQLKGNLAENDKNALLITFIKKGENTKEILKKAKSAMSDIDKNARITDLDDFRFIAMHGDSTFYHFFINLSV